MGSEKWCSTTTKQGALEKVKDSFDCLTTRQANLIRIHYGITELPEASVGEPAEACSVLTRQRLLAIEEMILERVRGTSPDSQSDTTKQRIIRALRKKKV